MLPLLDIRKRPSLGLTVTTVFLSLLLLGACGSQSTAPEATVHEPVLPPPSNTSEVVVTEYPAQCWFDRGLQLSFYPPETLAQIASCDVAVFPMKLILSPEGEAPIHYIRSLNPDIVILGEFANLAYHENWNDPQHRERFPIVGPMYDLLSRYPAKTTTGELAYGWYETPFVNPWTPNGYRESVLLRLIDIVCAAAQEHPGLMDGFFHDYLSDRPWQYPRPDPETDGWVDLDGDGIDSRTDDDELVAWYDWQLRLLQELQARFGPGLVQVANGRLPHLDAAIAANVAGIAYEGYPNGMWNYGYKGGFETGLEHLQPGYLTPRRGRTWSLLWDYEDRNPQFVRIASMMTEQFYCLSDLNGVELDPDRVPQGMPTGPLQRTEGADGSVSYTRTYPESIATLSFNAYGFTTESSIQPVGP